MNLSNSASPRVFTLHTTWRYLRDEGGLDFDAFAQRLRLRPDALDGDSLHLTRDQLFELWRMMTERVGEQAFIFSVRDLMLYGRFDTVFFAAVCSRDLGSGIRRLCQSKEALFPLRLPVAEDALGLTVGFDWFCDPQSVPDGFVLAEIIVFVAMTRFATGQQIIPRSVHLVRLPADPAPYENWLGVPLVQAQQPQLQFNKADLRRHFGTCNLEILKLLDADLAERVGRSANDLPLDQLVKQRIEAHLASGDYGVAVLAETLGFSVRGLQRELSRLGSSYQELLTQARRHLANRYLAAGLPHAEIAILLGYEEINSLRRFLRNQAMTNGQNPTPANPGFTTE